MSDFAIAVAVASAQALSVHCSNPRQNRGRYGAVLLAFAFGCATGPRPETGEPPENGQTGSPSVPPDYDTPGFQPAPTPPTQGPSPTFPERPLEPPQRTALQGSTLYVAERERGVLVFDVDDPTRPAEVGRFDVSGEPLWLHASDGGLWVVARGLDVERQRVVDRLLRFGLEERARAVELSRLDLGGRFVAARAVERGVVLVTAHGEAPACSPEWGPQDHWVPTTEFALQGFEASASDIEAGAEVRVAGDGYVEFAEGFAITLGPERQTPSLQLVKIDAEGQLTPSERIELAESLVPTTPLNLRDDRLRLFEHSSEGILLTEVELEAPSVRRSVEVSTSTGDPSALDGSAFSGDLVLTSAGTASEPSDGARVISFAGEAPEVVFAFDTKLNWFFPVERTAGEGPETWLGFAQGGDGSAELVRFELGPDGAVSMTDTLPLPGEVVRGEGDPPLWLLRDGSRALIPYRGAPADDVHLGSVNLEGAMTWEAGSSVVLANFPVVRTSLPFPHYWVAAPYESQSTLFGLTSAGAGAPPQLLGVPLGRNLRSLVARSGELAALEQRGAESWLVHGPGDLSEATPLDHSASSIRSMGEALLVGGLGTQAECEEEMSACPSAPLRFSVIEGSGDVRGTFDLPWVEIPSGQGVSSIVEWLELVVAPSGAGLLQRRGFSCHTEAACEGLDIPYLLETDFGGSAMDGEAPVPMTRAQGQIDELWLYPIDGETPALGEPSLLDRLDAYEFITGQGFVQGHGFSLLSAKDVVLREEGSGIESARLSLRFPPSPGSVAAPLRGWPMAVLPGGDTDAARVITVEPSAAGTGDTLHLILVDAETTALEASLALGDGYRAHAWGRTRGYVLSQSADLCADDRSTRLRVVQSGKDALELGEEFSLAGHGWRFLAQDDDQVVLEQELDGIARVIVLDVTGQPELVRDRVLGRAWFAAREAVVAGGRAFLASRTAGLIGLGDD